MTSRFVLDSWALVALLKQDQPTSNKQVEELLQKAARGKAFLALSIINLGEIYYNKYGRADIMVVIGGVSPAQDVHFLLTNYFD